MNNKEEILIENIVDEIIELKKAIIILKQKVFFCMNLKSTKL